MQRIKVASIVATVLAFVFWALAINGSRGPRNGDELAAAVTTAVIATICWALMVRQKSDDRREEERRMAAEIDLSLALRTLAAVVVPAPRMHALAKTIPMHRVR